MTIYSAYDEIADLLAEIEPDRLLKLKASEAMQLRLEELIEKSNEGALSKEDKDELDHYIVLERLIRLAKIRAQKRVSNS